MVERQLRRRGIEDERVLRAMADVPRERFVPEDMRERAYRDGALPIGEGQTISQPWIVARMTELLELEGPERVLEVGTGSGYGAAGAPDRGPFDGILVTAAAAEGPPRALVDQLVPGRALVCPVERGGDERLVRFRDGVEEMIAPVRFVPLVEGEA